MTQSPSEGTGQGDVLSVAIAVDGRIAEDKLCIDCGYNLRGLKPDGRCPECGGPVAASLRGHELHTASLPWLRTVCRGFRRMKKAILLSLLGLLATLLLGLAVGGLGLENRFLGRCLDVAIGVYFLVVVLLGVSGFVGATQVEPRVAARGEGFSPRRRARVLAVFALALWGLLKLIENLATGTGWMDQFVIWAPLILAVAGPLAVAGFVAYVIGLLERTADEKSLKSAKETRQLVNLAIALAALVLVANALGPFLKKTGEVGQRIEQTAGIAAGCNSCVVTIFAIGMLQLIWRMSKTMDSTLAAAEPSEPTP